MNPEKLMQKNEKYLKEFENWLIEKGLGAKTINKHMDNIDLFLSDFMAYYLMMPMEEGCSEIGSFFSDFFIPKCMWATPNSVKMTAASIKKFYQCMVELNYVSKEDYDLLVEVIKEEMEVWEVVAKHKDDVCF